MRSCKNCSNLYCIDGKPKCNYKDILSISNGCEHYTYRRLEKVLYPIRADYCSKCDTRFSLELYTVNNNPLRFSEAISKNITENLKRYKPKYFKCRNCGRIYGIRWEGDKPYPLYNSTMDDFLNGYKLQIMEEG